MLIALAGIALLAACKGRGVEAVYDRSTADSASVAADTTTSAVPKLVKTADMSFKVKSVQQTGDTIAALTAKYKGVVTHHQMNSEIVNSHDVRLSDDSVMRVSAFNTKADMTMKIPSEKLEDFMNLVSRLGTYVTSRKMDIEDKSLDYLSAQLKLQSRREFVARQKNGKVIIKNPEAVLWLKDEMVDGTINNQKIDDAVKYSIISLSFYKSNTILNEKIANDDPSAYQLPFFKRLYLAFTNGWYIFTEVILGIANLWMLIVAGIGLWLLYKMYKRKPATT